MLAVLLPPSAMAVDFVGIDFRRHELKLGFGKALAFESDVFNSPYDSELEPDLAWNVEYDFNIDEKWALGLAWHGFRQDIPASVVLANGETREDVQDFDAMNYGIKGKYYLLRNPVQPFGFLSLNIVDGSVAREYGRRVELNGFSLGVGAGALVQLWWHLGISVEGNIDVGAAQWKDKPFLNSESLEINPGHMGCILHLVWLW